MSEPSAGARLRPPLNRRRDKDQVSCDLCRNRKVRCDRQRPCSTCASRGLSSTCTYPVQNGGGTASNTATSSRQGLKRRLALLERQIVSLLERSTTPSTQPITPTNSGSPSEPNLHTLDHGSLDYTAAGNAFFNYNHWTSILNSIIDVKTDMQHHDSVESPEDSRNFPRVSSQPKLLYGCPLTSVEALFAAIPDRQTVDHLVLTYFNDLDLSPYLPLLHEGTFLQEYEAFWSDPSNASLIWLGLLFGIMSLSTLYLAKTKCEPMQQLCHETCHSDTPQYLTEVVQCLCLGEYADGGPYVIETLMHYLAIEHWSRPDTEAKLWIILGITIRIAFRMGYHRDPQHLPSVTVYEGEIRRRLWAVLYCADVLLSVQVGCPKMIQDGQWDTQPPLNLYNADFDQNSVELLARPDDELTPIRFVLARYKMTSVMGMVSQAATSTTGEPHDHQSFRKLLEQTYNSLPSQLMISPGSGYLSGHPREILNRILVSILLHKAQIILHWQVLSAVSSGQAVDYTEEAQEICVKAAVQILEYQQAVHEAAKPGGSLFSSNVKLTSTLSHEFLMATAVLSSILYKTTRSATGTDSGLKERILTVLQNSYKTWTQLCNRSNEARRATELLGFVFQLATD